MKAKIPSFLLAASLLMMSMAGCNPTGGNTTDSSTKASQTEGGTQPAVASTETHLRVVASFYPMYDFVKKIAGDKVALTNLVPVGVEPHDWEPTAADMVKLKEADLIVYNGAGLEHWVEDVQASLKLPEERWLNSSSAIEFSCCEHEHEHDHEHEHEHDHDHDHEHAKEAETKSESSGAEGKEASASEHAEEKEHDHEHEHDHDHEHCHHHHHDHDHDHGGLDPHVWLSPVLAKQQLQTIAEALIKLDPTHKTVYEANLAEALKQMDDLDAAFQEMVKAAKRKEFITSHEAFGYLARQYGLEQMGIAGLDADQEPSPARMAELVDFAKEHDVKVIFFEELVSPKLAETLAKTLGVETAVLNPLEGLSEEDLKAGKEYFSIMKENLEALKKALY